MNQDQVNEILSMLEDYYDTTVDEDQANRWYRAMAEEDNHLITTAAGQWVRTEKWFPKPSDLIRTAPAPRTAPGDPTGKRHQGIESGMTPDGGVIYRDGAGGGFWMIPK
jgi:hypothetical protein